MARQVLDCNRIAGNGGCTLRISGEEHEIERMALLHAIRNAMQEEVPGSP